MTPAQKKQIPHRASRGLLAAKALPTRMMPGVSIARIGPECVTSTMPSLSATVWA